MWQNRGRTGYSIVGTRLEPPEHGYSLHGAFMVLTMHYASAYCTHKVPNNFLIDTRLWQLANAHLKKARHLYKPVRR